jgi:hypothetical protein
MATNIHIAGVKAIYMKDVESTPMAVNAFYPSLKVKNPAGDTITVNPVAAAFNERFRENESYPAFILKDPKSGRIDTLTWEVLDWDDTTVELYLGGASATDDVWMAPTDSYCAEKTVRIDFLTGWTWYFPRLKIAAAPGGDGSAAGSVNLQVVAKVQPLGELEPFQRIATPVLASEPTKP